MCGTGSNCRNRIRSESYLLSKCMCRTAPTSKNVAHCILFGKEMHIRVDSQLRKRFLMLSCESGFLCGTVIISLCSHSYQLITARQILPELTRHFGERWDHHPGWPSWACGPPDPGDLSYATSSIPVTGFYIFLCTCIHTTEALWSRHLCLPVLLSIRMVVHFER